MTLSRKLFIITITSVSTVLAADKEKKPSPPASAFTATVKEILVVKNSQAWSRYVSQLMDTAARKRALTLNSCLNSKFEIADGMWRALLNDTNSTLNPDGKTRTPKLESLAALNADKAWDESIALECARPLKQDDIDAVQQMSAADAIALAPFVENLSSDKPK